MAPYTLHTTIDINGHRSIDIEPKQTTRLNNVETNKELKNNINVDQLRALMNT